MLETITITCPRCSQRTQIAVARGEGGGRRATTACRACRARFVAITAADGVVHLFDGDGPLEPGRDPPLLATIGPAMGPSGYHVAPPSHLGIFERGVSRGAPPAGVSDEELHTSTVELSRILRLPDGSARAPEDAARDVGWRGVWIAQLHEAVEERLSAPPPLSFPPGIFVSYRWGTDAANRWVVELARGLKARGYPVFFDRDEPGEVDVPALVSRIADARYFLAILDAGYAARIGNGGAGDPIQDGWVYDELWTAKVLSNARLVRIVGLRRDDHPLTPDFEEPRPGTPGNVVDVRTPAALAAVVDDLFPPIAGAPDDAVVEQARALLARSHEGVCEGCHDTAWAAAQALTELLPDAIDGPAQKVRVALHAGWGDVGVAAAEEALALAPASEELARAAGVLAHAAGDPRRTARHLARFLELCDGEERAGVAQAHLGLGSALDDLEQLEPAIAHLEIARRQAPGAPSLLNVLGYVYRRAGDSERAIDRLREGLAVVPGEPQLLVNLIAELITAGRADEAASEVRDLAGAVPDHLDLAGLAHLVEQSRGRGPAPPPAARHDRHVTCTSCDAHVGVGDRDVLCARCGSVLPIDERVCSSCGSDGRLVPIPGLASLCPYCRRGELVA